MFITATIIGAAIAGIVIYLKPGTANMSAKNLRDKARKIFITANGQSHKDSLQTM